VQFNAMMMLTMDMATDDAMQPIQSEEDLALKSDLELLVERLKVGYIIPLNSSLLLTAFYYHPPRLRVCPIILPLCYDMDILLTN
jgi:hypothetical protein